LFNVAKYLQDKSVESGLEIALRGCMVVRILAAGVGKEPFEWEPASII